MALKLYNTRTRQKENFEPIDPNAVRMYVCGPTVYDFAHIGNARPVIVFDVLFRLLRHLYGADHVIYARNITDVDDKINARAAERGISIGELTAETARQFHDDIRSLGVLMPDDVNHQGKPLHFIEPRATQHIEAMQALISRLIERGHAYEAEGHVLFDVASDADYGLLAKRSVDEMRAGARVEVAPYKRDPMDFVLWKPSSGSEPGWNSPWGYGRPGWHLECSAMSDRWLWEEARPLMSKKGLERPHEFDIHGGGIDLLFPHHENEVAQSTCAHGTKIMANIWMHNGHLQVEGAKMSKSLGNFITIHDLLVNWHGYGWPGEALRFNMLRTHYRQPLDWTFDSLDEAHKILWDWYASLEGVAPARAIPEAVLSALSDDLNTPALIAELHKLFNGKDFSGLLASLSLLGFSGRRENLARTAEAVASAAGRTSVSEVGTGADINRLVTDRLAARKGKNWKEADRIRDELSAMGVVLKDAKNPATGEIETTWEIAR
jgi:cysteinyl-tRNA synthetase